MRQGSLLRQGDHLYKSIAGKSYCRKDAAFESKADIQRPRKHVRTTPKSRHVRCNSPRVLWANSGHSIVYSINSSARRSSGNGMLMPSDLAAFRLMANSNLVGCWTGRSLGIAPLRILSTYVAPWRYWLAMSGP